MGLFYPESLGRGWNFSLTHIISSITFETLVSDLPGHRRRPRPGRGRPHKGPPALPSSNYPSFPPPSSETRSFFICQEAVCLQVELQSCAEKRDCFAKHQPGVAGCSRAETFSQLSSISFAQPCTLRTPFPSFLFVHRRHFYENS